MSTTDSDKEYGGTDEETLLQTRPSLKPTALLGVITGVLGAGIAVYLEQSPRLLGEATPGVQRITILLTVLVLVSLVARAYALARTSYVVTTRAVHERYTFLLREKDRRLPFSQIRATELDRGRLETVLGYGSIRFLTGGTNQSLGYVDFSSVPNPNRIRDRVHPYLIDDDQPKAG